MTTIVAGEPYESIVKNQHGHYIITVTGLNLTGVEENARYEEMTGDVDVSVQQLLISTGENSYDAKHRLEAGKEYKIAIVPGELSINEASFPVLERVKDSGMLQRLLAEENRLRTLSLQEYGASFGYQNVLAGHIPRIREAVSNKQWKDEMGDIWYIAGLHDPIKFVAGSSMFCLGWRNGVSLFCLQDPEKKWPAGGAFAFDATKAGA